MPPIVGSLDSTLLHFAAANGHSNVVRTPLLHGVHADRADKHGVALEMLAWENGKEGTVEMLKEWLANKDWDLREREGDFGSGGGSTNRTEKKLSSLRPLDMLDRKRLHVKQSIDRAVNSLKAYCPTSTAEPASPRANTPSTCLPDPILTLTTRYPTNDPRYRIYTTTLGRMRSQSCFAFTASCASSDPSTCS
jgi:hypothetical protein